uniref:Uncharacterized protein n=1 Tax=Ditylenchus dipsaci TaxID=166011 RepID=A0A915E5H0_9BILA
MNNVVGSSSRAELFEALLLSRADPFVVLAILSASYFIYKGGGYVVAQAINCFFTQQLHKNNEEFPGKHKEEERIILAIEKTVDCYYYYSTTSPPWLGQKTAKLWTMGGS